MKKRLLVLLLLAFVSLNTSAYAINSVFDDEVLSLDNLRLQNKLLQNSDQGVLVAILQRNLKENGYYNGRVDGVFGPQTLNAVRTFQKENGLQVDGIVGIETYRNVIGDHAIVDINYSIEDIHYLVQTINAEARGESMLGKIAVGAVILNRVEAERFPDTIKEVVKQSHQFTPVHNGIVYRLSPDFNSQKAALKALIGYDPTNNSVYFYNPDTATNLGWTRGVTVTKRIGNHVFAK